MKAWKPVLCAGELGQGTRWLGPGVENLNLADVGQSKLNLYRAAPWMWDNFGSSSSNSELITYRPLDERVLRSLISLPVLLISKKGTEPDAPDVSNKIYNEYKTLPLSQHEFFPLKLWWYHPSLSRFAPPDTTIESDPTDRFILLARNRIGPVNDIVMRIPRELWEAWVVICSSFHFISCARLWIAFLTGTEIP